MNSMPKHEAQAMVASFDSQYWHCGESDEIAAPQLGQLRVCACICVMECAGRVPIHRDGDGALDRATTKFLKALLSGANHRAPNLNSTIRTAQLSIEIRWTNQQWLCDALASLPSAVFSS
jgi:hypothetical protein